MALRCFVMGKRWFALGLALTALSANLFGDAAKIKEILDSIPKTGYAFLSSVKNETDYPANAKAEPGKNVHDLLPENSTVFIRSLDPKTKDFYFTVTKDKKIGLEKIDIKGKDKERALFKVHRHLSWDLHDWIGFEHAAVPDKVICIAPLEQLGKNAGDVEITKELSEFRQDTGKTAHWEIFNGKLDDCWIKNRYTSGCLYFFDGKKYVMTKKEEVSQNNDVWTMKVDASDERTNDEDHVHIKYGTEVAVKSENADKVVFKVIIQDENGGKSDKEIKYGDTVTLFDSHAQERRYPYISQGWRWTATWWSLDGNRQKWVIQNKNYSGSGPVCYGDTIYLRAATNDGIYFRVRKNGELMIGTQERDEYPLQLLNPDGNIKGVWTGTKKVYKSASVSILDPEKQTKTEKNIDRIITQFALKDTDDSWGTDKDKILCHSTNGTTWEPSSHKASSVSISADGHVWFVDASNPRDKLTIMHGIPDPDSNKVGDFLPLKISSSESNSFVGQVSAYGSKCYFILGARGDDTKINFGDVYVHDGKIGAKPLDFPTAAKDPATSISAAIDGTLWVVSAGGKLWWYEVGAKNPEWANSSTYPGAYFIQIAAKTKFDMWAIDQSRKLYRRTTKNWVLQDKYGVTDYVACAVGKKIIPAEYQEIPVKTASTKEPGTYNQKTNEYKAGPIKDDAGAHVAIDIDQLGAGGAIAEGMNAEFDLLPLTKNPQVWGFFSQKMKDNFNPKNYLKLSRLANKGIAWLDKGMGTSGKCTVSFWALPPVSGDVQVVFGDKPNNSFVWRVAFGASDNKESTITRRTLKNEPPDEIVCRVNTKVVHGKWQPFWVAIDDGLILAGTGNLGENPIMAWRDQSPVSNVNCIGFGSNKDEVVYCQVSQSDEAVNVRPPTRIYDTNPSSSALFRFAGDGAIGFTPTGNQPVKITLSPEGTENKDHYTITFDSVTGISLTKTEDNVTSDFGGIKKEEASQNSKKNKDKKSYWISYCSGNILVGDGDMSDKKGNIRLLFAFKDPNPIAGIRKALFDQSALSNVKVSASIVLAMGEKKESYQFSEQALPFSGGVTIVLPFQYQFSQQGQQVFVNNILGTGGNRPIFAIPEQGAEYNLRFTIEADGTPKLGLNNATTNLYKERLRLAIAETEAEQAQFENEQARTTKQGEIDKAIKDAEAKALKAEAEQATKIGTALGELATKAMGEGGPVGAIAGAASYVIATATIAADSAINIAATEKEKEGDLAMVEASKKALKIQEEKDKETFKIAVAKGSTETAFRGSDSYVYVEDMKAPTLGESQVPQEAKVNRAALLKLMAQYPNPTIAQVQNMLDLVTHYYVVADQATKNKLLSLIHSLIKRAKKQNYSELIRPLFTAYNNVFLTDEKDKNIKKNWLKQIKIYAHNLLENPESTFTLDSYFGEYVWIPQQLSKEGGLFTFQARGSNDLFVCFSSIDAAIRNSQREIYEFVFGGWDNSKSVIRTVSLGHSVQEVDTEENTDARLNDTELVQYWINLLPTGNGQMRITVGRGAPGSNIFLDWTDPYPPVVKYIGLSSWNSTIEIKNWKVEPARSIGASSVAPAKSTKENSAKKVIGLGVTKKVTEKTEDTELSTIEKEAEIEAAIDEEKGDTPTTAASDELETLPDEPEEATEPN